MDQSKLRYLPTHEWADIQGDVCTVGITQYAVEQLTDVTHLQLPAVGKAVTAGAAVRGDRVGQGGVRPERPGVRDGSEKNTAVEKDPSVINQDPYGKGWMIKIKLAAGGEAGSPAGPATIREADRRGALMVTVKSTVAASVRVA